MCIELLLHFIKALIVLKCFQKLLISLSYVMKSKCLYETSRGLVLHDTSMGYPRVMKDMVMRAQALEWS